MHRSEIEMGTKILGPIPFKLPKFGIGIKIFSFRILDRTLGFQDTILEDLNPGSRIPTPYKLFYC